MTLQRHNSISYQFTQVVFLPLAQGYVDSFTLCKDMVFMEHQDGKQPTHLVVNLNLDDKAPLHSRSLWSPAQMGEEQVTFAILSDISSLQLVYT